MTTEVTSEDAVDEVLRNARAIILSREHWTHDFNALDSQGKVVDSRHSDATQRCVSGALVYSSSVCFKKRWAVGFPFSRYPDLYKAALDRVNAVSRELYYVSAITVNDGPDGHAKVLNILSRAAKIEGSDS